MPRASSSILARLRRRWRTVLLAVVVVLGAAWWFRSPLLGPLVARTAAGAIASAIDGQAGVARATGGWLGDAALHGISASGGPHSPLRRLEAGRIAASYHPGLLLGRLQSVQTITAENVLVDLDLDRSTPTRSAPAAWPPLLAGLGGSLPQVQAGGDLRLALAGHRLASGWSLAGGGTDLRLHLAGLRLDEGAPASADVPLALRRTGRLELAAPVELLGLSLRSLGLEFAHDRQQVEALVAVGEGTVELLATATRTTVTLRQVDLAALPPTLTALLPAELLPLAGRVDGELVAEPGAAGWTLRGTLDASGLAVRGLGPLRLTLRGSLGPAAVDLRLTLASELERLVAGLDAAPDLAGRLELAAELSGDPRAPLAKLTLATSDLRLFGVVVEAGATLHQDADGLLVSATRLDAGGLGELVAEGRLPLVFGLGGMHRVAGRSTLHARLTSAHLERWLPRWCDAGSAEVVVDGVEGEDWASATAALRGVRLKPLGAQASIPRGAGPATAAAAASPGAITVAGDRAAEVLPIDGDAAIRVGADGLHGSARVAIAAQEVLRASLELPGLPPLQQRLDRQAWLGHPVKGSLDLVGLDLQQLAPVLGWLRHLAGTASGHLACSGSVGQPRGEGRITVSALEAKLSPAIPTLTAGTLRLALAGSKLTIEECSGLLGEERITAQGTVRLDAPGGPAVSASVAGNNLLLLQRPDARLRADLALTAGGTWPALLVAGDITVTSALLTPELSLLRAALRAPGAAKPAGDGRLVLFELEPPLSELQFDLRIASRPEVEGRDDGVRLTTDVVRAVADLDLRLGGTGAAPQPEGRIQMRKGVLVLPACSLRVIQGELVFAPGKPFAPRLNAVATTRLRGHEVTVRVEGPLADPQVTASANGLDDNDAMMLVTTGATPSELETEGGQRGAVGRAGAWLGLEAWRMIEGPGDPDSGPGLGERLTLDWGRKVSADGRDTIEAEFLLTPLERALGLLLYGQRDRYEDYNMGFILRWSWGGDQR
jgi:hypothetical protein